MKPVISILLLTALTVSGQAQERFSLKESIAYGLQHNRTVSIYKNNRLQAEQKARQAASTYLPNVNVSAGLDDNIKLPVTIIPAGTFGPGTPEQRVSFGTRYNSTHVAQLDQPIFDKAALTGLKARQPNIDYAALTEVQNNENLVYNIAVAYFRIIVAQKQLDLLLDNKARMEKNLDIAQLRAQQGVAKKIDIKQVQVNINNIVSQISVTRNSLELAINTLKFNMGIDVNESIALSDTTRWLNPENKLKKADFEFDYKKTTEFALNQTEITLLDINRKNIRDSRYPTLGFYARYGANGFGNKIGDAYERLFDFGTIGLKFQWNIFSGFRKNANYKIANYDFENAKINLLLKEDQQRLTFQNADLSFNRAETTIATNKENMDLAKEVYDNVSLQHREGLASLTELLNAENSYQQAQSNYVQSLLDYYIAEIDLRKANGSLTEYYNNL